MILFLKHYSFVLKEQIIWFYFFVFYYRLRFPYKIQTDASENRLRWRVLNLQTRDWKQLGPEMRGENKGHTFEHCLWFWHQASDPLFWKTKKKYMNINISLRLDMITLTGLNRMHLPVLLRERCCVHISTNPDSSSFMSSKRFRQVESDPRKVRKAFQARLVENWLKQPFSPPL